ncbi:MAG: AbrB/MazE/SpoVT family DNA-binding domain-containing protein [Trueperaceae bacterium]|nr:AbrB/MazE/SpoVT family DNA-binding domain-containing protein [Trueperaceae bacterium]
MPLVTIKKKYQVVIPQEVREQLQLNEGDLLEAHVENGRQIYTPKLLIDRDAAFNTIETIGAKARSIWEAEGKTEEAIEALILETIEDVRNDQYKAGETSK